MSKSQYTEQQKLDFKAFERVRAGGRFNMFDPRARQLTRLSEERYAFVMDNYDGLSEEADGGSV